ncbi:MAG: glycosyltransferase [Chitinophagaceae bacterium]
MISVIVCSINIGFLAKLKENIAATIGVTYELISIDNRSNQFSICEAYNKGGGQAIYPYLCFIHEDIIFETENWGPLFCKHLSKSSTGLVGVAGGDTKSYVPSSWSIPFYSNEINIIQHYKNKEIPAATIIETNKGVYGTAKKVAVLDGVLLGTRKNIFDAIHFDEHTFTSFHGYDIDYSLQVGLRYDLFVLFDVLIHHYSEGNPNKQWMQSAIMLSNKWKKILPVSVYPLTTADFQLHYWKTLQVFIDHCFRLQYSILHILYYYGRYSFGPFFSIRRFLSLGNYIGRKLFHTTQGGK